MILTESVVFKWSSGNRKNYSKKGYEYTALGDQFSVKIKDLSLYCEKLVDCKCDLCGKVFPRMYATYVQVIKANRQDLCPYCTLYGKPNKFKISCYVKDIVRGNMHEWKQESLKHHNHKCIITGEATKTIHHNFTHSYLYRLAIKELGFVTKTDYIDFSKDDIDVLSKKCLELHFKHGYGVAIKSELHKEFHVTYGYKEIMTEEFEQFKTDYISRRI